MLYLICLAQWNQYIFNKVEVIDLALSKWSLLSFIASSLHIKQHSHIAAPKQLILFIFPLIAPR